MNRMEKKINSKKRRISPWQSILLVSLEYFLCFFFTDSSTPHIFAAIHFDLCVTSPTDYTSYIRPCFKYRTWKHYYLVRKIDHPRDFFQRYKLLEDFSNLIEYTII